MPILFTGRKADLTPALKRFAETKLSRLDRFLGEEPDVHVILTVERHRRLAEIVARTPVATLTARADSPDFRESIDRCLDRIVAQAKRSHDKQTRGRRRRETVRAVAGPPEPATDGRERPSVVRMGRIPVKPMSVDEAVFEIRDSRDGFLVFRNAASQRLAVLFRREDGRFGLIEPEA
jgi:putative sigma-54 modulation protein